MTRLATSGCRRNHSRERALRFDDQGVVRGVVDRCPHQGPAEAMTFEVIWDFRVYEDESITAAHVVEMRYVPTALGFEAHPLAGVDDVAHGCVNDGASVSSKATSST